MSLPFGGTVASDDVRDRHDRRRVGWGHDDRRLRRSRTPTRVGPRRASPSGTRKPPTNCSIDYGFHQIIGGVDEESLKAMTYLVDNEGITSFKLFMAYPGVLYSDDGQILRAMQNAVGVRRNHHDARRERDRHRRVGGPVDRQAATPTRSSTRSHVPPSSRAEATHRAIQLVEGGRQRPALHRPHVGVGGARRGRGGPARSAYNVFAETCPQYLYLSLEDQLMHSRGSRAPSGCAPPRCEPSTSTTTRISGRAYG